MKKTFHELCGEAKINVNEKSVQEVMKMIEDKEEFIQLKVESRK